MKKFLTTLLSCFEAMGRARAASMLTRQGKIEEARKIMLKN